MESNHFSLGTVLVSPSHNELSADNHKIKLQPKAMAVLTYLAANCERVVSNEELIQRLWEGRVVTHGSVQKSINALRTAFSELMGEQEIIAHYSKRGYQLKMTPVFNTGSDAEPSAVEPSPTQPSSAATSTPNSQLKFKMLALCLLGLFVGAILYKPLSSHQWNIKKLHETTFQTRVGYTNETGHERNAVPHPDNNHVAYIREKFNLTHQGETNSEIVVRNNAGKDWHIATSQGSWFKLAWSPSGMHLVAIEVKRDEGLPLSPNFYEKPNYLYTFHIFTLDLEHERLIEKQLLSQWQGRIFSVTWWDENTLEFVAQQGTNSSSTRYRYSTENQQLSSLDETEGASNLTASVVLNKKTALASTHKNSTQIDFLDEHQAKISRWQLNFASVDISWIPDGSGILVYADEERKLMALYLNGQQQDIPFADTKDSVFSKPRYSADGKSIFYTEEKLSVNIQSVRPQGHKIPLTENTNLNYAATFSPSGEQVVYASVRNNQTHLWLINSGQEHQLTTQPIATKVSAIIWSDNDEYILFSTGNNIYQHHFLTAETTLLLNDESKIEPISYRSNTHTLLALKGNGDTKNVWRINTQTHQQKQLTFGSVGSAIEYQGDIYFQYTGEHGLWVLRSKADALEQLSSTLAENSKLLTVDSNGIYWVGGGLCRESDIQYFHFNDGASSTFLTRESNIVSTSSFIPSKGALETDCYLPEANIVQMR